MGVIRDRIKQIVEEKKRSENLSISELARRMGYSSQHIWQLLNKDEAGLKEDVIEKFLRALEVDLDELGPMVAVELYADPEHEALHRRVQRLLDGGHAVSVERALSAIEQAILNAKRGR